MNIRGTKAYEHMGLLVIAKMAGQSKLTPAQIVAAAKAEGFPLEERAEAEAVGWKRIAKAALKDKVVNQPLLAWAAGALPTAGGGRMIRSLADASTYDKLIREAERMIVFFTKRRDQWIAERNEILREQA